MQYIVYYNGDYLEGLRTGCHMTDLSPFFVKLMNADCNYYCCTEKTTDDLQNVFVTLKNVVLI